PSQGRQAMELPRQGRSQIGVWERGMPVPFSFLSYIFNRIYYIFLHYIEPNGTCRFTLGIRPGCVSQYFRKIVVKPQFFNLINNIWNAFDIFNWKLSIPRTLIKIAIFKCDK